jgi:hypothetical protein
MCMFNTSIIYYLYVDSVLVYNTSNNDTYLVFLWNSNFYSNVGY